MRRDAFSRACLVPYFGLLPIHNAHYMYVLLKVLSVEINPNWHEAGHFPPHVLFGSDFWQLNLYQKFPNCFGGVS
jgi:hypothetical protein